MSERYKKVQYLDTEDIGILKQGWIIRETPKLYYYICPNRAWKQQDVVRRLKREVIILE